jgi:hypothetical protein
VATLEAAFLVGLAGALAAELSAGLLLYATDGFLEALTLILALALGSLGAGLATPLGTAHRPSRERALQRRWFLAITAFGAAAVVSFSWSLEADPPTTALGRGVALALLEALPLYTVGLALGGISATDGGARIGGWAAFGAAFGVVLQGGVLLTRLQPFSVYLLGIVLLSGAALLHGRSVEPDPAAAEGEAAEKGADAEPEEEYLP